MLSGGPLIQGVALIDGGKKTQRVLPACRVLYLLAFSNKPPPKSLSSILEPWFLIPLVHGPIVPAGREKAKFNTITKQ